MIRTTPMRPWALFADQESVSPKRVGTKPTSITLSTEGLAGLNWTKTTKKKKKCIRNLNYLFAVVWLVPFCP
jgi:hypothetical protein